MHLCCLKKNLNRNKKKKGGKRRALPFRLSMNPDALPPSHLTHSFPPLAFHCYCCRLRRQQAPDPAPDHAPSCKKPHPSRIAVNAREDSQYRRPRKQTPRMLSGEGEEEGYDDVDDAHRFYDMERHRRYLVSSQRQATCYSAPEAILLPHARRRSWPTPPP